MAGAIDERSQSRAEGDQEGIDHSVARQHVALDSSALELNQPLRCTHSGRNRNVHDFQRPMRWQEFLDPCVKVIEPAMPGRLARAIAQFNGVKKEVFLFELPLIRLSPSAGKVQLECRW